MLNILITGARGQLGSSLRQLGSVSPNNYLATDVAELDITDAGAVLQTVKEQRIDVIVNCAAYTNVERAEEDEPTADLLNHKAAAYLAAAAKETGATLIHVSTDYVFDGTGHRPYTEDMATSPLGAYGRTKLAGEEAVKARQEKLHAILKQLPLSKLDLSKVGAGKTEVLFNRPEWKSLSESCLGCGTCTFVCPTCQCYDVQEFNTGKTVRRFRCWDSCMYSDFTKMSAGQPRPTQLERFRQRFMHKLVYFPDNNDGQFGCVGCGRCLQKCPIHMNIVKVIKTMGGGDDAK